MRKILFPSLIATAIISLSSCAISNEMAYNQNQLQTSVVLNQANYKIIGTATGECKQCYVLGIGGLSKKSLKASAIGEMMKNANLQDGSKAIINANVRTKIQFYLLWAKTKAIAEGQIIEFTK